LINNELSKKKQEREKLASYWKEKNVSGMKKQIQQYFEKEKEYNKAIALLEAKQEENKKISQLE
jgi:hypothetical protein